MGQPSHTSCESSNAPDQVDDFHKEVRLHHPSRRAGLSACTPWLRVISRKGVGVEWGNHHARPQGCALHAEPRPPHIHTCGPPPPSLASDSRCIGLVPCSASYSPQPGTQKASTTAPNHCSPTAPQHLPCSQSLRCTPPSVRTHPASPHPPTHTTAAAAAAGPTSRSPSPWRLTPRSVTCA